jgi:hypothetical protein
MCGAIPSSHIPLPTPSNSGPLKEKMAGDERGINKKKKEKESEESNTSVGLFNEAVTQTSA